MIIEIISPEILQLQELNLKKAWAVVIMIMDTTAANTKDIKTKK